MHSEYMCVGECAALICPSDSSRCAQRDGLPRDYKCAIAVYDHVSLSASNLEWRMHAVLVH